MCAGRVLPSGTQGGAGLLRERGSLPDASGMSGGENPSPGTTTPNAKRGTSVLRAGVFQRGGGGPSHCPFPQMPSALPLPQSMKIIVGVVAIFAKKKVCWPGHGDKRRPAHRLGAGQAVDGAGIARRLICVPSHGPPRAVWERRMSLAASRMRMVCVGGAGRWRQWDLPHRFP